MVCESTYGDRLHPKEETNQIIADIINKTFQQNGVVLIPAFAVGRTQELLYRLKILQEENMIPPAPIYMDSPMAIRVSQIYRSHPEVYDEEALQSITQGNSPLVPENLHFCRNPRESKIINDIDSNIIIISASGMATGGRVLHHLKLRLPHRKNSVVFVGYQAVGTRGRTIVEGNTKVKIHGEYVPINAKIYKLESLSAHADYNDILVWFKNFKVKPKKIFLVHGEEHALLSLKEKFANFIDNDKILIPELYDSFII